jgi:hypothetical protein
MGSYHRLPDRLCRIQLRDRWGWIAFDPRAENNKSIFKLYRADVFIPLSLVARHLGAYLWDLNRFPVRSLPAYGRTLGRAHCV